jgi:hypothetical protein
MEYWSIERRHNSHHSNTPSLRFRIGQAFTIHHKKVDSPAKLRQRVRELTASFPCRNMNHRGACRAFAVGRQPDLNQSTRRTSNHELDEQAAGDDFICCKHFNLKLNSIYA